MDFVVVGGVGGNLAEAAYPPLEGVHIIEAGADRPESQTGDGIPIIDRVPGIINVFFAAGWSGHGWAIAPAVCQLLAAWASARSRRCCVPSPMAAFWPNVLGPSVMSDLVSGNPPRYEPMWRPRAVGHPHRGRSGMSALGVRCHVPRCAHLAGA